MSSSTPNVDDHSSDAQHKTDDDEQYDSHPRGIEDLAISPLDEQQDSSLKLHSDHVKESSTPIITSTRGPSLSASAEFTSDAASVRSMPATRSSHQDSASAPTQLTTDVPRSVAHLTPTTPSRTLASPVESTLSQQERRARHRSAIEVRASNRLSGFFTNLIHRRDHLPNGSARSPIPEDVPSSQGQTPQTPSRSSSPIPTRPTTPPPHLPAPTLQELGLSLSVITSDLSPSHFSTPPASGAFLAPHYLLLCHAQGLDVLPLVSPPAPQPFALVRRVGFRSVVVMEQRGVLVAIAGRRDGVRVYALEEVKKAIEVRMEAETRRERERQRRDQLKKLSMGTVDHDLRESSDKTRMASLSTPPPGGPEIRNVLRKGSHPPFSVPPPPIPPLPPLVPRMPTTQRPKAATQNRVPIPTENPPPYTDAPELIVPSRLRSQSSVLSFVTTRTRGGSVSNVLGAAPTQHRRNNERRDDPDSKADWVESSDDEAIDIVAAGSSGSQALDERTSTMQSANATPTIPATLPVSPHRPAIASRRSRPSNLDLTLTRSLSASAVGVPEPSPAPTLLTLRQALQNPPDFDTRAGHEPGSPFLEAEEEDEEVEGRISLSQALMESRIPDLPPLGTRQPQQPILLTSSHSIMSGEDELSSPRSSEGNSVSPLERPERRRRRWSVLLSQPSTQSNMIESASSPLLPSIETSGARFTRSPSFRSNRSEVTTMRGSGSNDGPLRSGAATNSVTPNHPSSITSSHSSRSSRFIPRLISNAFLGRRSDDRPPLPILNSSDNEVQRRINGIPISGNAPPQKLEYVKLPGTKGAIMVKAVETAKKSFLAILCGDNGEKVELFAGTYRTALGLSRTFILPDSPRSLELQLQGDDLVEVFLVFSQNIFGLEPATVRVREVRIGRAERRAARRRAREVRSGDTVDSETQLADEDLNVNVSIGVSMSVDSQTAADADGTNTPPLISSDHPDRPSSPNDVTVTPNVSHAEELVALATAQMGPYTTFQQLMFAPKFPLASIADEYIIPPTYPEFVEYKTEHEPDTEGANNHDLAQHQFSPPGLPVPTPSIPSKWYYRDPKSVIHGPWKASLMQAWYKDGLLPLDLPVRREEDSEFTLLKDLRLQSVDPTHPFRTPPPPKPSNTTLLPLPAPDKPLLSPISLLSQPRHFGPPALFFSSRGGHSTAIVDARGRSVLKGRFVWSGEEIDEQTNTPLFGRMGDVKRLEAFDVKNRSVLVAMRQGGLEAVDLSDALLRPADESRTVLPQFTPLLSTINRRTPYVWKIGTPVSSSPTSATVLSSKNRTGHAIPRKQSTNSNKSPIGRNEFSNPEADIDHHDEVLFLGRKDDEIYICERNAGSFRILRLAPNVS